MASCISNAPSRVRSNYVKTTYMARCFTRLRHWWRRPDVPDLSRLPDHLIRDIGLPLHDPRREGPKPWIWVDFHPRG